MRNDTSQEFKTIGIVLDNFKVKRFRAVLSENGFETKLKAGVTRDTALLRIKGVHVDRIMDLQRILNRLQWEFANRN